MAKKLVLWPQKVKCPYCPEEFYPGECRIIATRAYKNWKPGDVIQEANSSMVARHRVDPLMGKEYVLIGAVRVCPKCDRPLPVDPTVKSYTIAIVGDGTSGKSHYIASCLHELQEAAGHQYIGCSAINALDDTYQTYYNMYYAPLFINKQEIPISQRGQEAKLLAFELVFVGKTINLLFYDASGEDMVIPDQMVMYSNYILNASAIIFLADPMVMPGILDFIPQHMHPQTPRTLTTAMALNRIVRTFRQGLGLAPGAIINIPIAITISKSDLLDFAEQTVNPPLYLRDTTLSDKLDVSQFNIISQQVQNMLYKYKDTVLLQNTRQFSNACFFAVSATGWPPDDQHRFPEIKPRRCLEPLLWTLWQLGIIN